jgi:hypothetical protein
MEKVPKDYDSTPFKRYSYTMYTFANQKKGDIMAKSQDAKKTVKKKSEKTLKEKRNDKKAKKTQG